MKEFILSVGIAACVVVGLLLVDGQHHEQAIPKWHCIQEDGRDAAKNGVPPTACPYIADPARHHWMVGWQQGYRLGLVEDE